MSAEGKVVFLDPDNSTQVRAVAELHSKLLKTSPIPRLGFLFMTRFFYRQLVKDGLIGCYLYRLGNQYVGFVSFTETPHSFMSEGKRRHFVRLSFILGLALLQKPWRLGVLWDSLTIARRENLDPLEDRATTGEVLSFAVLPEFRHGKKGHRISNILFDAAMRYFRERRFHKLEWNVEKENIRALAFYRSYGARFAESAVAGPKEYRGSIDLTCSGETQRDCLAEEPVA